MNDVGTATQCSFEALRAIDFDTCGANTLFSLIGYDHLNLAQTAFSADLLSACKMPEAVVKYIETTDKKTRSALEELIHARSRKLKASVTTLNSAGEVTYSEEIVVELRNARLVAKNDVPLYWRATFDIIA